jgi:CelD/BcsL family acetyltransferase involved in cellulose biosynthesis
VVGDQVMASQLMLETSCSTYASSSGSTADAWEYSPGTYLLSVAVADAREAGLAEVNLSAGPNQNKLRWSHEVRSYPEFAVVGPSSTSTTLFQAYSARAAIARVTEARRTHAD